MDPYTGEDPEVWWEDSLPTFEKAASWNKWTDGEKVIQLAGHLRRRALMEWNLVEETDKNNYTTACKSMQARMDPGCKAIAAEDFRHTVQGDTKPVMRIFRRAYGKDKMSAETKDTLLYVQLHPGLQYSLMKAGAKGYIELCGAAKSEERRQVNLTRGKN